MVESHTFIFADTISLDSRAARKYRWCLYIYVLSVNLRVPGPFTACTTDIVLMSEGGCKYSRCKRRPVIRSTACNQPTYLSTSNHEIFFWYYIFVCYILYQQHIKEYSFIQQTFAINTKSVVTHAQSPAYKETPQILLPVTCPTKTLAWVIPNKQKLWYTLV